MAKRRADKALPAPVMAAVATAAGALLNLVQIVPARLRTASKPTTSLSSVPSRKYDAEVAKMLKEAAVLKISVRSLNQHRKIKGRDGGIQAATLTYGPALAYITPCTPIHCRWT